MQTFVSAWVTQLRARGYVSGVYGSAASTARDMQALAGTPSSPDDLWIANWNGTESVFGDPYVSDALWTNHQRIHQYRGGHKETWGGVTINIDNDYVDAAVVGPTAAVDAAAASGGGARLGQHRRLHGDRRPGPRTPSAPPPTSRSATRCPG